MADQWCCHRGSSTTWMTVVSRGKLKSFNVLIVDIFVAVNVSC